MENRPTSISDLWEGKVTSKVKAAFNKTDAVLHGFNNKSNPDNKSEDKSKGEQSEPWAYDPYILRCSY